MHVRRAGPDVDNANSALLASSFMKCSCYTLDFFYILMGVSPTVSHRKHLSGSDWHVPQHSLATDIDKIES